MALDTKVVFAKPASHDCDLLAVLVPQGSIGEEKVSDAHFGDLDRALSGLLKKCAAEEEFSAKEGQSLSLHTHEKIGPARLLALGLGRPDDADRLLDALRSAASRAVKAARSTGARSLAIVWPHTNPEPAAEVQALAEGATLGAYVFDRYRQEKRPLKLASVRLIAREERSARRGGGSRARSPLAGAAALGCRIADATCLARDLVNEPAGRITPKQLAAAAQKVAKENGLDIEVLGRAQIQRLKMQLFLGV
ncbi:MAG: M17 family peptidase N-terminal domain-containing protein, partial [Myxococcales bacterium]